jgi:hypothetical protein
MALSMTLPRLALRVVKCRVTGIERARQPGVPVSRRLSCSDLGEARVLEPDAYFAAYRAAVIRNHRPQWSWARFCVVCRCGAEVPCRALAVTLGDLDRG